MVAASLAGSSAARKVFAIVSSICTPRRRFVGRTAVRPSTMILPPRSGSLEGGVASAVVRLQAPATVAAAGQALQEPPNPLSLRRPLCAAQGEVLAAEPEEGLGLALVGSPIDEAFMVILDQHATQTGVSCRMHVFCADQRRRASPPGASSRRHRRPHKAGLLNTWWMAV